MSWAKKRKVADKPLEACEKVKAVMISQAAYAELVEIQERTGHLTTAMTVEWLIRADIDAYKRLCKLEKREAVVGGRDAHVVGETACVEDEV